MSAELHNISAMSAPSGKASGASPREPLRACVSEAVDHYFAQMNGHEVSGLYQLVIAEVEKPLLASVMRHSGGNQTRAATVLGISRSTLRKKLAQYELD